MRTKSNKTAREIIVLPGLCVAEYRTGLRYLVLAGRVYVGAGTTSVSVQITIDRINDISDKKKPSDMAPFNDQ